jgi:glycosyltransferase involved in cell wall biosynthesis
VNNSPLVSILINNYNYERFLGEAINSALGQTYSPVEVVVVDDGSRDNSRELIASYGERIVSVFKKNGGQASAFNAGFAASRGEIVCFLDADDYCLAEKITQIVDRFRQNPQAGWVFHELQDVDANGNSLVAQQTVSENTFVDLRGQLVKGQNLPYFPATSGLCFKRDVLKQILPMPEELLISADNFLRLAAVYTSPGWLSADQLAIHRMHGSNLFEMRPDNAFLRAETNIKTSYYLRKQFPGTKVFTNKLYAYSFGRLAGKTNFHRVFQIPESKEYMTNYISFYSWLSCAPRMTYNYIQEAISWMKP